MARCRTLFKENEELGKQISQGRIAKLEGEIALEKKLVEEMKVAQNGNSPPPRFCICVELIKIVMSTRIRVGALLCQSQGLAEDAVDVDPQCVIQQLIRALSACRYA